MDEIISDYSLQNYLKKKLQETKYCKAAKELHSVLFCAVRLIRAPMHVPGVFVIANDVSAKIWGVQHCKSSWACPVCSAKRMSKEASRIATAIDALNAQGKKAFMLTLAIPHVRKFSCEQAFEILQLSWKRFSHNAKSKTATKFDVFAQFANDVNCEHRIRVCEFTWGKNGWHPHYHCLFFVDSDKLQTVGKWQESLANEWLRIVKMMTARVIKRDNLFTSPTEWLDKFYQNITEKPIDACYISRDDNGNVREAKSSQYICGWGADKELTGNIRKLASHRGHFTPHQILEKAWKLDRQGKFDLADKWFSLYIDYALTTKGKYRVRFSLKLSKIINQWRQTEKYIEALKKKAIEEKTNTGVWRTVCWFNELQWYKICLSSLLPEILARARLPNAFDKIADFLLEHQIDIRTNGYHPEQQFLENRLFNAA